MSGTSENGRYYYGAILRSRPAVATVQTAESLPHDADACDEINARRFFGFGDYEEVDTYALRSRRATKIRQSPGMRHVVDHWFGMLERINIPLPVKTWRQMMDEGEQWFTRTAS